VVGVGDAHLDCKQAMYNALSILSLRLNKMKNIFKYLPLLMEIMPHISHMTDDDCAIEEKADHVLEILSILAEETDTELDDLIIDRVQQLTSSEAFWDTLQQIVDYFRDSDEPVEFGYMLQEERNLDPATIAIIIEVVGLLVRLWRDRK